MSATEELPTAEITECQDIIMDMYSYVEEGVKKLDKIGLHKQNAGRYLEPWMNVKGVITSTEMDNFYWLRLDKDAQPEIQELARCMYEAQQMSTPEVLKEGEWHTPYVNHFRASDGDAFLEYHCDRVGVTC